MTAHHTQTIPLQSKIQAMVQRIVEEFNPEKVILFGSYARGKSIPDSDVDILVVMPVHGSKRELRVAIRKVLRGFSLPKDVVVVTPDELRSFHDVPGTIVYTALVEGQVLYDRAA